MKSLPAQLTKHLADRVRSTLSRSTSSDEFPPPIELRRRILEDRYLKHHYKHAYELLAGLREPAISGATVEIGSGSGIVSDFLPGVIATDIVISDQIGVALDACHLPFRDESVASVIMKDALHHIPEPELLLAEVDRVLVPGGVVIVMDPYWGLLARFVFKWLHPEPFDDGAPSWAFTSKGPNDSNQALLSIMLRRDRRQLESLMAGYEIIEHGPYLGPSFLLSGGLHGRLPFPGSLLVRLFNWESRQGPWLDPLRFEFIASFHKNRE